jgi:DNA-binding transcriptional ArsR family regulator
MVQYDQLDRKLAAIADPTRRRVLERLGRGEASISELAEPFAMSLTGMKKHVRLLEDARLLHTQKVGRARLCSLGPERLDDLERWLVDYRALATERLERLDELVTLIKGETP